MAALSPADKAQLLRAVARQLGDTIPGVESQPNVCGGEACIARTRIPVWVLEQARRLAQASPAEALPVYREAAEADRLDPTPAREALRLMATLPQDT